MKEILLIICLLIGGCQTTPLVNKESPVKEKKPARIETIRNVKHEKFDAQEDFEKGWNKGYQEALNDMGDFDLIMWEGQEYITVKALKVKYEKLQ
ncbi:MAG: hypothetical protein HY761_09930 [Candidatus Omnitrophica bacterium]|nr:hypothetical protein [Candidatus Omnitrophota bacterium]